MLCLNGFKTRRVGGEAGLDLLCWREAQLFKQHGL